MKLKTFKPESLRQGYDDDMAWEAREKYKLNRVRVHIIVSYKKIKKPCFSLIGKLSHDIAKWLGLIRKDTCSSEVYMRISIKPETGHHEQSCVTLTHLTSFVTLNLKLKLVSSAVLECMNHYHIQHLSYDRLLEEKKKKKLIFMHLPLQSGSNFTIADQTHIIIMNKKSLYKYM